MILLIDSNRSLRAIRRHLQDPNEESERGSVGRQSTGGRRPTARKQIFASKTDGIDP